MKNSLELHQLLPFQIQITPHHHHSLSNKGRLWWYTDCSGIHLSKSIRYTSLLKKWQLIRCFLFEWMSKSLAYVYLQKYFHNNKSRSANHRITWRDFVGWVSSAVADTAVPAVVLLLVDFESHLKKVAKCWLQRKSYTKCWLQQGWDGLNLWLDSAEDVGLEFTPRAVPHGSHLNDPPSREVEGVLALDGHLHHLVVAGPPVEDKEDQNQFILTPSLNFGYFKLLTMWVTCSAMGSLRKIILLTEMIRKSPLRSPLTTTS